MHFLCTSLPLKFPSQFTKVRHISWRGQTVLPEKWSYCFVLYITSGVKIFINLSLTKGPTVTLYANNTFVCIYNLGLTLSWTRTVSLNGDLWRDICNTCGHLALHQWEFLSSVDEQLKHGQNKTWQIYAKDRLNLMYLAVYYLL